MRVSYDWLKTMIDVPESPKELSDEYIRTGTEVEAIDVVGESFDHVVTAQVLEKAPHPDSDHMYVCKVSVFLDRDRLVIFYGFAVIVFYGGKRPQDHRSTERVFI